MEPERKSLRIGLIIICAGILLRILGSGILTPMLNFLTRPDVASFLIYLETGRVIRLEAPHETLPPETQSVLATTPSTGSEPIQFTQEDAGLVNLYHFSSLPVDETSLLLSPLNWNLRSEEPTVLILHSHASECYTKTTEDYEESYYRTQNTDYNMVRIGSRVAQLLEEAGIRVIHDRSLHDDPSYLGSYENSRRSAKNILAQHPSIFLILDLHRDAADVNGGQLDTSATVNGRESAQLMLVVGSNAGGLSHPHWQENMALAEKLHVLLQKENPGICRPICFRNERFNQDLLPGTLLVEVGAAGNTLDEALIAAEALAEAIIALADGANS